MDTLGLLELTSIAGGIEIVDAMLKVANVKLVFAKASCPGKYYIILNGKVADVEKAVALGVSRGGGFVVSSGVISRVHEQVIKAINGTAMPEKPLAIGVMEFFSVMSSIAAADTAVKAARVEIVDLRLGTGIGGKSFVVVTGDPASVNSAVEAASRPMLDSGMLVNKIVIANPRKELIESLL
ncbi:MAG: BMC domain-containing protein [Spirochaetaceae bacterium]|jgi:microcompartment protein CcmL/EutN|nr:BMC domain-containing protein [Spirochaetaceae bacterium]